jgi:hypothetical protein
MESLYEDWFAGIVATSGRAYFIDNEMGFQMTDRPMSLTRRF